MSRKEKVPAGKDTFHIVGGDVELKMTGHGPKVALLMAMGFAEHAEKPCEIAVWRRTLLGPEVGLYTVTRDELGTVRAYTINEED